MSIVHGAIEIVIFWLVVYAIMSGVDEFLSMVRKHEAAKEIRSEQ